MRLPGELIRCLKRRMPRRRRSPFVRSLIGHALPPDVAEASVAVCGQERVVIRTRLARAAGLVAATDPQAVQTGVRAVLGL